MSDVQLNGLRVLGGRIEMPRIGLWVADLDVDADTTSALTGAATVTLGEALALSGTVVSSGAFASRGRVRVVGGAGGMGLPIPAKDYRFATASLLLSDTLALGGETLSSTADADKLSRLFTSWTRSQGTVGAALQTIVDEIGGVWRVLPDGTVWLGDETWPATAARKILILEDNASTGRLVLAAEDLNILPGTTVDGRMIGRVVLTVQPDGVSTEAWVDKDPQGTKGDPLVGALDKMVNHIMRRVDYHALYACKVVVQNADGSLDLLPDDARMPTKCGVPMRLGIPGTTVKVAAGARVLLGFENGDPSKPIATLWETPGMTEVSIGGNRAVARQADSVLVPMPAGTTTLVGILNDPGPQALGVPAARPVTLTLTVPISLMGSIITASGKLKTD